MNKEVIKAINRSNRSNKERKIDNIRRWWYKNSYKIARVILFPIWFGICAKEKINEYLNSKEEWNEERANEILNYYAPRVMKWDAIENEFYYFDNGLGWNIQLAKKHLKRKDYRFWSIYSHRIRKYFENNFELKDFTKEIIPSYDSRTEIIFKMK